MTVANGGDNIGVYMPSFAVHSGSQVAIIAVVFVVMTALWCMLAHRMVSHPRLGAPLRRYGHIVVPLVLIGLGILIIHNAGSIPSLLGAIYRTALCLAAVFLQPLQFFPYFDIAVPWIFLQGMPFIWERPIGCAAPAAAAARAPAEDPPGNLPAHRRCPRRCGSVS